MGLLDPVAEPREALRKLAPVERAEQHLRFVEPLVRHRAPLAVLALDHVGDHRVGVERRVEVARGVVAERRDHRLLVPGARHAPGLRVLHAGLGDVLLEPGQRARDGPVMGLGHAHLRTTNPIESTFATVRLRTIKSKGCLSRTTDVLLGRATSQAGKKRFLGYV